MGMVEQPFVSIIPVPERKFEPNVRMGDIGGADNYIAGMLARETANNPQNRVAVGQMFQSVQKAQESDRPAPDYLHHFFVKAIALIHQIHMMGFKSAFLKAFQPGV